MSKPFVKIQAQTLASETEMITLQDLPRIERRGVYPLILVELANALQESIPASSEDPQSWEVHPVVSQYLDRLDDEDVVRAIDLANGCNY